MKPIGRLIGKAPITPDPGPLSHLPVRRIATTGATAAAALLAVSAASAAASAARRRADQR